MTKRQHYNAELRSEQSKTYIADALLQLMQHTDYSSISIQDIVDRAGVSRMAYYRNFDSKDDIIRYQLRKTTRKFMDNNLTPFHLDHFHDYLKSLFCHLLAQKDLALVLQKADLTHLLKEQFDDNFIHSEGGQKPGQKPLYNYLFISGGIFNVYTSWLSGGCKETPEQMADCFSNEIHLFDD